MGHLRAHKLKIGYYFSKSSYEYYWNGKYTYHTVFYGCTHVKWIYHVVFMVMVRVSNDR